MDGPKRSFTVVALIGVPLHVLLLVLSAGLLADPARDPIFGRVILLASGLIATYVAGSVGHVRGMLAWLVAIAIVFGLGYVGIVAILIKGFATNYGV